MFDIDKIVSAMHQNCFPVQMKDLLNLYPGQRENNRIVEPVNLQEYRSD